jgi:hypothetical protein
MKKKFVIVAVLVLVGLIAYYFINGLVAKQKPFLIKTGQYPLTVQFISDTPGVVNIVQKNDTLFLTGKTISNDSSGYLYLSGYLQNVVLDSFNFVGKVNIFASENCCGKIEKEGVWTFRRMEDRTFFRLKERDKLCSCDTCCIYMDIHTNQKK